MMSSRDGLSKCSPVGVASSGKQVDKRILIRQLLSNVRKQVEKQHLTWLVFTTLNDMG
jgi:hypothetical protein